MKKILLLLIVFPASCFGAINTTYLKGTSTTSTALLACGSSDTVLLVGQPFTVSIWIYEKSTGGSGGGTPIVRGGIRLYQSTGPPIIQVSGSTTLTRTAGPSLSLNVWTNIIYTGDGSTNASNYHIYVNNSEVSYTTTTNGVSLTSNSGSTTYLGNVSATTRNWDGYIGDTAVWNRVVSSTERSLIYHGKVQGYDMNMVNISGSGPVAWWRLTECPENQNCATTNQFNDSTGNGNACTGSGPVYGLASQFPDMEQATINGGTIQ